MNDMISMDSFNETFDKKRITVKETSNSVLPENNHPTDHNKALHPRDPVRCRRV